MNDSLNLRSLITSRVLAQNILIKCEKSAGENRGMRKNRIAPICDLSNEKSLREYRNGNAEG